MKERQCGHQTELGPATELFGDEMFLGPCEDCADLARLYGHVESAMAGNVFSLAALAEAGLITPLRPTLANLNNAGRTIYVLLTPAMRERLHKE
mgnify:FL=1